MVGDQTHCAWELDGEAIVAVVGRHHSASALPDGLDAVPGPRLLTATRYTGSPMGPYLEVALAEPARLGRHVGWCRTMVVVDRADVQRDTRMRWGVPALLGSLIWKVDGDDRSLSWHEAGVVISGRSRGVGVPWVLPQRLLQDRGPETVVLPTRLRGLAHPGAVRVDSDDRGPDAWRSPRAEPLLAVQGSHLGAVLTGLHGRLTPARAALAPAPRRIVRLADPARRDAGDASARVG